jgi:hypothetical protein
MSPGTGLAGRVGAYIEQRCDALRVEPVDDH